MSVIYIEGQYKNTEKKSDDYVTKQELDEAVEDITAKIEGIDHEVVNETLIVQ